MAAWIWASRRRWPTRRARCTDDARAEARADRRVRDGARAGRRSVTRCRTWRCAGMPGGCRGVAWRGFHRIQLAVVAPGGHAESMDPVVVFSLVMIGLVAVKFRSFKLWDELTELVYTHHRGEWEALGRPLGYFWRPDEKGVSTLGGMAARRKITTAWLSETPEWMPERAGASCGGPGVTLDQLGGIVRGCGAVCLADASNAASPVGGPGSAEPGVPGAPWRSGVPAGSVRGRAGRYGEPTRLLTSSTQGRRSASRARSSQFERPRVTAASRGADRSTMARTSSSTTDSAHLAPASRRHHAPH